MCDAPARVWDIVGKGRIAVGYDADLVLVDLERTTEVRNEEQVTKCGWSPWHGVQLTGLPIRTWVMGHEVYREGVFRSGRCGQEVQFDHARGGYWATPIPET
jgi:dihydroorotase